MRIRTLVNVVGALVVCAVVAAPAAGQTVDRANIGVAYSYLHESGTGGGAASTYSVGWVASAASGMGKGKLAIVAEAGANYRKNVVGERQQLWGVLGGARVALWRKSRTTAFAQALAGMERFSEPGFTESGLAFQPGAGVDYWFGGKLGLRLQGDLRIAREEGVTFREFRFAAGVVFGLGK